MLTVDEDSPAENAGLDPYFDLIIKIDNVLILKIEEPISDLMANKID